MSIATLIVLVVLIIIIGSSIGAYLAKSLANKMWDKE